MLLRSITNHVKDQNWFAVGIDFVIVVVGVFIGLQVANWNDAIADNRKANEMLASVLVDLQNEKAIVQATREYWATAKDYGETAIAGFNEDETVDDEQFVISAYQASQALYPLSNRATYEQMVSSGNINVAGTDDLREAIVGFYVYDWAQGPDNVSQTPYRANIRRVVPHIVQAAIRGNCGDQIIMAGSVSALYLPKTCDLSLPPSVFASSAITLRKRPDLLMDLRHQLSDLDAKLQNLRQVDKQLDDMLALAALEENR